MMYVTVTLLMTCIVVNDLNPLGTVCHVSSFGSEVLLAGFRFTLFSKTKSCVCVWETESLAESHSVVLEVLFPVSEGNGNHNNR